MFAEVKIWKMLDCWPDLEVENSWHTGSEFSSPHWEDIDLTFSLNRKVTKVKHVPAQPLNKAILRINLRGRGLREPLKFFVLIHVNFKANILVNNTDPTMPRTAKMKCWVWNGDVAISRRINHNRKKSLLNVLIFFKLEPRRRKDRKRLWAGALGQKRKKRSQFPKLSSQILRDVDLVEEPPRSQLNLGWDELKWVISRYDAFLTSRKNTYMYLFEQSTMFHIQTLLPVFKKL